MAKNIKMGILSFFKPRKRTHEENIKGIDFNPPIINEVNPFNPIGHDDIVKYTGKGISKNIKRSKSPWIAYIVTPQRENKRHRIHIGSYPTKEEAIEARYNFIKSLI